MPDDPASNEEEYKDVFFLFFLYGAAAHIGPWPPLYEVP
jgi:hypothetical protein